MQTSPRVLSTPDTEVAGPARRWRAAVPWLLLAAALAFSLAVRWRLRDFPLERDEGEFAYAGQLLLEGVPPYKLAYNMKLPGTYLAYAGLMAVFGQTTAGIHIGLIAVNLATIILVFFFTRDLFDGLAGGLAAIAYALLALDPAVLGLAAHATHFVAFFGTAGAWVLWRGLQRDQGGQPHFRGERGALDETVGPAAKIWTVPVLLFASGVLFGAAFLMKQQGVFLPVFGCLMVLFHYLLPRPVSWRRVLARLGPMAAGSVLPYAATCLWLWQAGVFDKFWFWTVSYARQYTGQLSWEDGGRNFLRVVGGMGSDLPIWIVALAGAIALAWPGVEAGGRRGFVFGLLGCSFLCACPGLFFREHYFIVVLVPAAMLAGFGGGVMLRLGFRGGGAAGQHAAAMPGPTRRNRRKASPPPAAEGRPQAAGSLLLGGMMMVLALAIMAAIPVWQNRGLFFIWPPDKACREIYSPNPFVESQEVARYLSKRCSPQRTIAVLGSEPQLFFQTGRRSATGFIYTYALVERQAFAGQMQDEMIAEIEASRPEFLVFVDVPTSWLTQSGSETRIFTWAVQYMRTFYRQVGVVEIWPQRSEYRWDAEAANYRPRRGALSLIILQRNS